MRTLECRVPLRRFGPDDVVGTDPPYNTLLPTLSHLNSHARVTLTRKLRMPEFDSLKIFSPLPLQGTLRRHRVALVTSPGVATPSWVNAQLTFARGVVPALTSAWSSRHIGPRVFKLHYDPKGIQSSHALKCTLLLDFFLNMRQ